MSSIVSFIGEPERETTLLAARIVSLLTGKGYSVAVARSTGSTTPGNTGPRQAEVPFVTLITPDQMTLQLSGNDQNLTLLSHRFLRGADIVIAEGFENDPHIPKINVSVSEEDPVDNHFKRVIAVVTNEHDSGDTHFHRDDNMEIADFIEKRFLLSPRSEQTVLIVNNKKIALNGFIQSILANTVAGFTDTLKKTGDKKDIELYITRFEQTEVISP